VPDFTAERTLLRRGFRILAGVDEVGRGALCGPVVAAAVILPSSWIRGIRPDWVDEVRDSKLLAPKKRRRLSGLIRSAAVGVGIGSCSNEEIDRQNIFRASMEAMRRAVSALDRRPDAVLVDGYEIRELSLPQRGIPRGDKTSILIAAASIVAKVFRDEVMVRVDALLPGYGLSRNKGYGTREHYRALDELGPTPYHRRTFKLRAESRLFI